MACKVRRKRHNPWGEAGSGNVTPINRAPQDGLHDVGLDDLRPGFRRVRMTDQLGAGTACERETVSG